MRKVAWSFAGLLLVLFTAGGTPGAAAPPAAGAVAAATVLPRTSPALTQQSGRNVTAPQVVTLITGDRIMISADGTFAVTPRPGVQYMSYRVKTHRYVIPSDAIGLLKAGRLDQRLFDLAALGALGASGRTALPLIVSGASAVPGLVATDQLRAAHGFATKIDKPQLSTVWRNLHDGLTKGLTRGKVWLDAIRKPTLDVSVPLIGAPAAWAAGLDGTGVTVAVLDTGIDATHPDLSGQVVAQRNFTDGAEDNLDRVGHGTHVASTIAGTGAASNGRFRGVAPGAHLLDGKVCTLELGCAESSILAGMQWAAESGADVVNMSLGGEDTAEIDPLEQAVNDLTAQFGMLFVIAAGNSGEFGDFTVESPGSAAAALTVGASTKADELAFFSARGPSLDGFAVKPEITAPGVNIVAARSKDGTFGDPGQLYTALDGTSMATPHVAGAAAILTQQHPDWSPQQRKATLMASATQLAATSAFAQGAGRLDVARAIGQQVSANPPAISFGAQTVGDAPHTETVTYHNAGATSITLDLTTSSVNAPESMFTLSATRLPVPANGDASVTLTADTGVAGSGLGFFDGVIYAGTGDGISVQTPFGIDRQPRTVEVHTSATRRDGTPADEAMTIFANPDTFDGAVSFGAQEDLRLPEGTYFAWSWIPDGPRPGAAITQITHPGLVINQPQTVNWNARIGKPFKITVPDPTARPEFGAYHVESGSPFLATELQAQSPNQIYAAQVGPRRVPGMASYLLFNFAKPNLGKPFVASPFENSPYVYHAAVHHLGAAMAGTTRHFKPRDFATVDTRYAAFTPHVIGARGYAFGLPGLGGTGLITAFSPLPAHRTEYFVGDVQWVSLFIEEDLDGIHRTSPFFDQVETTYRAGRSYHEEWNRAVFGPSVAPSLGGAMPFTRDHDTIAVFPQLWSDASGRAGVNTFGPTRIALFRNGTLVGTNSEGDPLGFFDVPPGPGHYRLQTSTVRDSRLSTRVESVWTFTSATTEGEVALPALALSFQPKLNPRNNASAGTVMTIPILVTRSGAAGPVAALSVKVSFDDGATWATAPVAHDQGTWTTTIHHPAQPGFVSLRATARDARGDTVQETIIRAYGTG